MTNKFQIKNYKLQIILLAVLLVLAGGLVLWQFNKKAEVWPENVQVSNITEKTATVSWMSAEADMGCVVFTPRPVSFMQKISLFWYRLAPKFLSSNKVCDQQPTDNHHLGLSKLNPETDYYYQIVSGNKVYTQQLYSLKTDLFTQQQQSIENLPELKTISADRRKSTSPVPIYATVLDQSGNPLTKTLAYLNTDQAVNQLSCLTDNTGSYYFDLSQFYDKNLNLISWGLGDELEVTVSGKSQTIIFGQLTPGPDFKL